LFVPGKVRKESHLKIKDLLITYYDVIVVNSDGKILYTHNGETYDLKNDFPQQKEFNECLPDVIKKYNIDKIAIIGNLSIGRGVTFVNKDFIFSDDIIINKSFHTIHVLISYIIKIFQMMENIYKNN
jgi:hypothetical protein